MKVTGKGGISCEIIADSISNVNGKRLTTFELEYPRFIHSEFMTHRLFSRNAASSRAIPVEKMIDQVEKNLAMPVHWGKNQPGMQALDEILGEISVCIDDIHFDTTTKDLWKEIAVRSIEYSREMASAGLHKQIVNRILEPYQFIKVVCTATEFDNFFWLRCHEDAQPEIKELADCMYKAYSQSIIQELEPGEWHVPYVDYTNSLGYTIPVDNDYENGRIDLTLEEALKVSSSCCAQISYRVLDNSVEKACKIYDMLVESKPVHASPFEHQGTPMKYPTTSMTKGVTHRDTKDNWWSGNFQGFIQHRQLIPENVCWEYKQ